MSFIHANLLYNKW